MPDRTTTPNLGLIGLDIADHFGYEEKVEFTEVNRSNLDLIDSSVSSGSSALAEASSSLSSEAVRQSTSDEIFYVTLDGSDSNSGSESSPFRTVQKALNTAREQRRHRLVVYTGTGSFDGAYVDGFGHDAGYQTLNAVASGGMYIAIVGTPVNATGVLSGISGTFSAATVGTVNTTTVTFGTATDPAKNWIVNELEGKFVEIMSGLSSGTFFPIESNTSASITVCGTWTAPVGSTYVIREQGTIFNGAGPSPANDPFSLPGFVSLNGIFNYGSPYQYSNLVLARCSIRSAGSICPNLITTHGGKVNLQGVELMPSITGASSAAMRFISGGFILAQNCTYYASINNSRLAITSLRTNQGSSWINSLFRGNSTSALSITQSPNYTFALTNCAVKRFTNGFINSGGMYLFSGLRFSNITGEVISNANSTSAESFSFNVHANNAIDFTNCGTCVRLVGPVATFGGSSGNSLIGSGNTTVLNLSYGAAMRLASTSTVTGTTEALIDGSTVTFAAMRALTPRIYKDANYLTRLWE